VCVSLCVCSVEQMGIPVFECVIVCVYRSACGYLCVCASS